jgi:hypothetical protein
MKAIAVSLAIVLAISSGANAQSQSTTTPTTSTSTSGKVYTYLGFTAQDYLAAAFYFMYLAEDDFITANLGIISDMDRAAIKTGETNVYLAYFQVEFGTVEQTTQYLLNAYQAAPQVSFFNSSSSTTTTTTPSYKTYLDQYQMLIFNAFLALQNPQDSQSPK